MAILRWLIRIVLLLALAAGAVAIAARVHDGPLGPFPGGALASGTLVAEPVADWGFVAEVPEIELQLESQSISRVTWVLARDGRAYIPASVVYPPGKTWHRKALEDGRAVLRIDGKKYPVTLAKVEDAAVLADAREEAKRKYDAPAYGEDWLFSVTSRSSEP